MGIILPFSTLLFFSMSIFPKNRFFRYIKRFKNDIKYLLNKLHKKCEKSILFFCFILLCVLLLFTEQTD